MTDLRVDAARGLQGVRHLQQEVPIELAAPGHTLRVESEHGTLTGRTATIPFVDPAKERPAQPLQATA
jgi:hypothetical protein